MRTKFCSQFVDKRPRKIEIPKIKITLFREIFDLCIPTMSFSAILKKLKYPIDESRIIQYIDYGERRNRESRIAPILVKREKMNEPTGSEMHTPHRGEFYPSKLGKSWAH